MIILSLLKERPLECSLVDTSTPDGIQYLDPECSLGLNYVFKRRNLAVDDSDALDAIDLSLFV